MSMKYIIYIKPGWSLVPALCYSLRPRKTDDACHPDEGGMQDWHLQKTRESGGQHPPYYVDMVTVTSVPICQVGEQIG